MNHNKNIYQNYFNLKGQSSRYSNCLTNWMHIKKLIKKNTVDHFIYIHICALGKNTDTIQLLSHVVCDSLNPRKCNIQIWTIYTFILKIKTKSMKFPWRWQRDHNHQLASNLTTTCNLQFLLDSVNTCRMTMFLKQTCSTFYCVIDCLCAMPSQSLSASCINSSK